MGRVARFGALGMLVVLLAGVAMLGAAQATSGPQAAIELAAAAPFHDEIVRDARGLCSDLTPAAAAALLTVPAAAPGSGCEAAVGGVFAATTPPSLSAGATVAVQATAERLTVHGNRASGVFSVVIDSVTEGGAEISPGGRWGLELELVGGRWLVSSEARLTEVPDCAVNPPGKCRKSVQRLLFWLGEPLPEELGPTIPVPRAVKHAGGRVLREFEAGATVVAQSGCLACHKIGTNGNRGPGPNLTRIGARLGTRQIERALISPTAPMPSFRNLPHSKLRAVVRFLSLLK